MTQFCLVRHGQTDWNVEGRYAGQSDVALNENGLRQARSAAEQLRGKSFAAVYSSDLGRARQTAEIIASSLDLPVITEPRLKEINQGEWEGQHVDVIKARYRDLWMDRQSDPTNVRPPGGETVAEVAERVYAALDDIACIHPDADVLIVSHGLALATIICKVKGLPVGRAYEVIPENATPIWVQWEKEKSSAV